DEEKELGIRLVIGICDEELGSRLVKEKEVKNGGDGNG
ncbi:hypothetical protein A2U01_0112485, partial [Trifolium medium]|nr:hypothetical protein [Trifolium medium]